MKNELGLLGMISFYVYFAFSQLCMLYFWYTWAQSHNFISTLLLGPIVAEIKGLLFPFFI